ncbi:MAG: zf-HC2 domain-containing protein [Myxococcota bacterium]
MREVGGLRCDAVLAALSEYIDGDLPPDARARIAAHLEGCPECERFGAGFAAMVAALGQETPPALDRARLVAVLTAALRDEGA